MTRHRMILIEIWFKERKPPFHSFPMGLTLLFYFSREECTVGFVAFILLNWIDPGEVHMYNRNKIFCIMSFIKRLLTIWYIYSGRGDPSMWHLNGQCCTGEYIIRPDINKLSLHFSFLPLHIENGSNQKNKLGKIF